DDPSTVDITAVRARVAALGTVQLPDGEPSVKDAVDDAADNLTRLWLTANATVIRKLPDNRQPTYTDIRAMARQPERVDIVVTPDTQVDTVDTDWNPLPTTEKHLLSDSEGNYPLDMKTAKNRWERATIA